MSIPENLKYSKDHEWVSVDGDIATVGITDFAQGELGDIIFVEFPSVGDSFSVGDTFGTMEAVKTVADLFMPLGGTIAEINTDLEDAPEAVNNDSYAAGWIVKIKMADAAELESLMDAAGYGAHIE